MEEEKDSNRTIKQWAEEDRPREKFLDKGRTVLSNAELLAILIRTGTKNATAIDIAKTVLTKAHNNLIELSRFEINDFKLIKGIGRDKAITILAALELGKRRREEEALDRKRVRSSKDVFEYMQSSLTDLNYEEFWILMLNRGNKVIDKRSVSSGGLTGTIADPRIIFKMAIENNASYIILCHNHPSGNVEPSEADLSLTKKLKAAGEILDIAVMDHIIFGDDKYYSFKDQGIF
ncbi:MAG: DNA repair protein RadC [Bacteroidales bacterium]|nr:DNA repair protein RadC [Bacteroidales bacterium]